jgi:hypothetical protein
MTLDAQVNAVEQQLRDFICTVLQSAHGTRWWRRSVPADIKEKVDQRIAGDLRKKPYLADDHYQKGDARLQFCDVMDYHKLIVQKQNWVLFEPYVETRDRFEVYLLFFNDFRNSIKHNRDIDQLSSNQGELSVRWLEAALHRALPAVARSAEEQAEALVGSSVEVPSSADEKDQPTVVAGASLDDQEDSLPLEPAAPAGETQPVAVGATSHETDVVFLGSLPLSPDEEKLLKRIRSSGFAEVVSVDDLLALDVDAFSARRGVGQKYLVTLRRLRERLAPQAAASGDDPESSVWPTSAKYEAESRLVEALSLTSDEIKLLKRINNCGFANPRNAADILALDIDAFADVPGVGRKYVVSLHELRERIDREGLASRTDASAIIESDDEPRSPSEAERLADVLTVDFALNPAGMTPAESKALSRLANRLDPDGRGGPLTANRLLAILSDRGSEVQGVGRKTMSLLRELAVRVRTDLLDQAGDDLSGEPPRRLVVSTKHRYLAIGDIERMIIADVDACLACIPDREREVAQSRWGYRAERRTLEEIGQEFGCTRERIRQLENRFQNLLPLHLRVPPSVIWANIKPHLESDLGALMSTLSARFERHPEFVDCLEVCCGDSESLIGASQLRDRPDNSALDELYARESSPYSFEVLFAELMRSGYRPLQAKYYISDMVALKRLRQVGGGFVPSALNKELAIAHALLDEPDGLHWQALAKKVNRFQLAKSAISEERTDQTLTWADSVFLCDRGSYRHTRYLKLQLAEGLLLVDAARTELERLAIRGANLQRIHPTIASAVDYYELRYYLREFGEARGLYFEGRSSADTLALDPEFGSVTGEQQVLEWLDTRTEGMTKHDVAALLRSRSAGYAALVLGRLAQSGDAIIKTRGVYVAKRHLLAGIDREQIMGALVDAVSDGGGCLSMKELAGVVNAEVDQRYLEQFYTALLDTFGADYGLLLRDDQTTVVLHSSASA